MAYTRKNEIPPEQKEVIQKIAELLVKLHKKKGLSIERFCVKYDIPRITYGNLLHGNSSFQITTLLSVIKAHEITLTQFIIMLEQQ
jgi:predicted transcriptional regulator